MKFTIECMIIIGMVIVSSIALGDDQLFESYTLTERTDVSNERVPSHPVGGDLDGFVYISAGKFAMGSPGDEIERRDEEILHEIYLAQPIYFSITEVTVGEFRAFIQDTDYQTTAEKRNAAFCLKEDIWKYHHGMSWEKPGFAQTDSHPVVCVSWYDVVAYCNWRSKRDGLEKCYKGSGDEMKCNFRVNGYRLPTEAEWERACRGGTQTRFSFGTEEKDLENYAWFASNSDVTTHQVASKRPNDFGIYDMLGNAWEWCWDWYDDYELDVPTNPSGPKTGAYRVFRGGNFLCAGRYCRSALRNQLSPGGRLSLLGFRIVRNAEM